MTAPPVSDSHLSPVKRTLLRLEQLQSKLDAAERARTEPIAIVGMSCRFPGGANNPEAFWRLLRDGVDAITEVPPSRWNIDEYYDADPDAPGRIYCRHGGFLEGIDLFDPAFFRITPREAASMDPQQRILLEVTHEALEHAGIPVQSLRGSQTGVFIGITTNDYAGLQLKNSNAERLDGYFFTGNPLNTAAGRISYTLGSHGPSMALDTACSSSLASVHAACQSLRNQECDLAIAGGVNLILSPDNTIAVCRTRALAPDGRCKTFDALADGFVRSEGCGVLVLKGLARAMADGDHVLAVIRGSAINHDGASSGFTAPNGRAQEAVIRKALGDLPAHSIDYVEAHGTGTALGDPIEVNALASVLGTGRSAETKLFIGSVKTNIGHAESASGVAGVIKVVLALQHGWIPAHLHCRNHSPLIPWTDLPIQVCTDAVAWRSNGTPRRAGVSAFGASGTNVHVILEEAPVVSAQPQPCAHRFHPLVLSAKSEPALCELASRYQNWLAANLDLDIANVCFSAVTGRSHFAHRLGLRVSSREDAASKLSDFQTAAPLKREINRTRVAFLFTGQGAQYTGMGQTLYETQPVFREALDRCRAIADPLLEYPLLDVMFSEGRRLDQTAYSQPALFSLEYALTAVLKTFGISPDAVLGHSVGEYAAACVAEAMTLEDGLRLLIERARLMQALPPLGEMAAIFADLSTVERAIRPFNGALSIAAVNGPGHVVISGARESIAAALATLGTESVRGTRLNTSHAFHSPLMDPMLDRFEAAARAFPAQAPAIPLFSNLSGEVHHEAPNSTYWRRHCRESVQFSKAVQGLISAGVNCFIEIGPKPVLINMARACATPESTLLFVPALRPDAAEESFVDCLLKLYGSGLDINWRAFETHARPRVTLPSYPFQRTRIWFQEAAKSMVQESASAVSPSPSRPSEPSRKADILYWLRARISELIQTDISSINVELPFLEMGADSIVLIEAVRLIEKQYGVKLAMRRFFEDLSTVEALANHIDEVLPQQAPSVRTPAPIAEVESTSAVERLLVEQNRLMSQMMTQQIELLRASLTRDSAVKSLRPQAPAAAGATSAPEEPRPVMPWGSPVEQRARGLTPVQQNHLENLITRYTARTRKSKESVQSSRAVLADSRATVGFRFSTKEMLYPIVGDRCAGSRLWDIDGNHYIDFTMGFGVHLFGHAPEFIQNAVNGELNRALELGARSALAGEVATRFARVTGHERVAFSNTGTEAVMTAMRLARAITGREKIVMFTHSYHGHADGTLAAATSEGDTEAVAPGVPLGSVENMVVLTYGSDAALEKISNLAATLAAVLVEPVQSRNPSLQPVQFLKEIRRITEEAGAALIFDEMITGFRAHPAGAQALFGIRADLATYGKIIGGGMPLGVIAGTKRFMNGIDGGMWTYGDHSFPAADRTAFGGTFCQHPLAMAAALAVLEKIEQEGPALQARLNERTAQLAATLNKFFEQSQAPIRVTWFGSMFRFEFSANLDLFFYHLLEKGFYIWEWRTCFLSTAHTEHDLASFVQAVRESVEELRRGGFIPKLESSEPAVRAQLSEAQRQLWLLTQIDPHGSLAYNVNTTLELRGAVDLPALRRAIQSLVDRHEVLRTTISSDGQTQIVHPSLKLDIPVVETDIELWLEQESRQMFDLTAGPLFRAALLRVEDDRHLLALTAHHMICDGSTIRILLEDLAEAYRSTSTRAAPMQFREYLKQTRDRADSEEMRLHRQYWLEQCAEPLPVLNLPADRIRPAVKTFHGRRASLHLDDRFAESLRATARRSGCTLYMALLAGFHIFLHRVTGQDDILTGIPVTGRSLPGTERLAGYCTHLLPLRSTLQDNLTVTAFLAKTRKALLDALDHQDYPFAELVREHGARCDLNLSPIVSAVFNLEPASSLPALNGLELRLVPSVVHYAAFDLSVNVIDTGRELLIDCDYNTDLFDESTIQRLLQVYRQLLSAIASHQTALVSSLPLLSDSERTVMIEEWNDTSAPFPRDLCVQQLFEDQCLRTPDRTAIIYSADRASEERISYREWNERADSLAAELRAIGVAAGALIGVHARRNPDLLIAIFAVLKLGATYVPMDPVWPQARTALIMEDAAISVILTHRDIAANLPATNARLVFLDDKCNMTPLPPIMPARVSADAVAYVIYTSGSTGRPKGAAILHRNAVAFLYWVRSYFNDAQLACGLASTSICFDLSIFELFAPLSWGGSIALTENILEFASLPCANEITHISTVPSAIAAILKIGRIPESVNTISLAGEPLTRDLVCRIQQHAPQASVYNLYGLSEATVFSTAAHIEFNVTDAPTIGRPISNTRTYILDRNLQPLPVGALGELYVGGAGVGAGYLNRPELTSQRFMPDPYSRDGRLYQTGDLARYRPDGNIEFLGRSDDQIKLRGFRIELGEIEAALTAHPLVQGAIVALRGAETNARIVAWLLSPRSETELSESVCSWLRERLPEYMIPSAVVTMAEFPLLPNGKIDRNRLPDASTDSFVASEGELQTRLSSIWQEVLDQPRISAAANLFQLGGNSLSMVQIVSRIQRDLAIELDIRSLFSFPTIASLAKHISGRRPAQYVPISALPAQEDYELSPAQKRFWTQDRLNTARAGGPVPASFLFEGPLDLQAAERSFDELVDRHEILRIRFITVAGEPRQKIFPACDRRFGIETIDIRGAQDQDSQLRSLEIRELLSPMDLESGPLFRIKLIRLAETRHACICTMHHIVTDGWSAEILLDEFAALYAARLDGVTGALPALTIQYKDYAAWMNRLLDGPEGARMKTYWLAKLAAVRPLELPGDVSRGGVRGQRWKTHRVHLNATEASALETTAARHGATLFMALLSAIKALLYRRSGQEDITVGSPVAGRLLPELERQIGPYLNVVALRDTVTGADRYEALLSRVKDTTVEAFSNQLYPLDRLLDALQITRTPDRNPIFDIGFTLQNQRRATKRRSAGALQITELMNLSTQSANAEAETQFWFLADPNPDRLDITVVYDAARFSEAFAQTLSDELVSIIRQVAAEPEIRIRDLRLARTAPQQPAKLAVELGTF